MRNPDVFCVLCVLRSGERGSGVEWSEIEWRGVTGRWMDG